MRSFFVAASLAAAVLLGPIASMATAQESYYCAPDSAYYPSEYGWYGHRHVDTYGGRPYYFHNPYGHPAHHRR